jgi:tRNA threonylcarbamoyladenosine biosynthesis protein TsaB
MIAAIDSSSTDQSVALADTAGQSLGATAWTAERGQGSELLPRLLELLDRRRASLHDVTGVAVAIGPGSFTGLRVGLALAKGLAVGLSVPIVGIRSMDAWLAAVPDAEAALSRAGAAEAYIQGRGESEPRIVPFTALAPEALNRRLVAPRDLALALGLTRSEPPGSAAGAVARLAAERIAAGTEDDLARLEPVYVRPPRGLSETAPAPITWH